MSRTESVITGVVIVVVLMAARHFWNQHIVKRLEVRAGAAATQIEANFAADPRLAALTPTVRLIGPVGKGRYKIIVLVATTMYGAAVDGLMEPLEVAMQVADEQILVELQYEPDHPSVYDYDLTRELEMLEDKMGIDPEPADVGGDELPQ